MFWKNLFREKFIGKKFSLNYRSQMAIYVRFQFFFHFFLVLHSNHSNSNLFWIIIIIIIKKNIIILFFIHFRFQFLILFFIHLSIEIILDFTKKNNIKYQYECGRFFLKFFPFDVVVMELCLFPFFSLLLSFDVPHISYSFTNQTTKQKMIDFDRDIFLQKK